MTSPASPQWVRRALVALRYSVAIAAIVLPAGCRKAPPAPVELAKGGAATAVIVVDEEKKPNLKTAEAVAGLKSSLEAVTGAKFAVKTAGTEAPGESCIYVGDCAAKKLGVDPAKLGEDEWIVKAGDGKVYLAGGNWLGTSNAIWRFLEDGVGIRFWSAWEKDVPKRADLVIAPLDKRGTYDFSSVNTGVDFTFGAKKWKFYALDLDPGKYDVWLSARYDTATGTLFVERLVAVAAIQTLPKANLP